MLATKLQQQHCYRIIRSCQQHNNNNNIFVVVIVSLTWSDYSVTMLMVLLYRILRPFQQQITTKALLQNVQLKHNNNNSTALLMNI